MDISTEAKNGQLSADTPLADLLPAHLADLRASGLSDKTIAAAGLCTERDPEKIRRLLNWEWSAKDLGPCLVFPFCDLSGNPIDFARVKPSSPRTIDRKPVKYEQPRGRELQPYFPPAALEAIRRPSAMVGVTEGEKKSLAASQAGLPCIGLTGANAGAKSPRDATSNKKTGPPALLAALLQVNWRGRSVWIGADSDAEYKAMVGYGFAEFARLIKEQGGEPFVIDLPRIRDANGRWTKIAIDDFLVAHGADALHALIEASRTPPATKTLEEHRRELAASRVASVGHRGVYLDRSPTGAGKSYADIDAMRQAGKSLTVLFSHKNCRETEKTLQVAGLVADAYPKLDQETCLNLTEAQQAMEAGLAPTGSVCRKCPFKDHCHYQLELTMAQKSPHSIATMHRASLSFRELSEGRPYIAVHEDPAGFLRPNYEVRDGFEKVVTVAQQAQGDAKTKIPPDMDSKLFFWTLESAAIWLSEKLGESNQTTTLPCPAPSAARSQHCDLRLWEAMKRIGVYPDGDVMRICKAIAAGLIDEITIRIDKQFNKDGTLKTIRKAILAVFRTDLPADATVWIADATATVPEIEALVGRPIIDATPAGNLEQQQPVYQLAADITQNTASSVIVRHVRAVLAAFPEACRVGVITHKKHVHCIEGTARKGANLDEESRRRIVKADYFRSGGSRGSNEWIEECDLLIVAGTPRPNPAAIQKRLTQLGMAAAAARDAKQTKWGPDWWAARTVSGKAVTVKTLGYADWDWRDAYEAIVGAELIQAVGRARSVCDNGIPVVVISTHKIGKQGYPLLDADCRLIADHERAVIQKLTDMLSIGSGGLNNGHASYINIIGTMSVSSTEIAAAIGKTERHTRRLLEGLERAGYVERIGQRGGWRLIIRPAPHTANGAGAGAGAGAAACENGRDV